MLTQHSAVWRPGILLHFYDLEYCTCSEYKSSDNGGNHDPSQSSTIMRAVPAITIATTTIMSFTTKAYIFEPRLLLKSMGSNNEAFHPDCGIDVIHCGIGMVACGGAHCLRTYSLYSR